MSYIEYSMDQQQIAAELGVTRQAVQQIEVRALKKCRRILKEWGLSPIDFFGAAGTPSPAATPRRKGAE